jgi:hypothetical protein
MKKTIYIELPLVVEWDYTPGEEPVTWGPIEGCTPGSDDEIDIVSATIGGIDILHALAPAEQEALQTIIEEANTESLDSLREDAAYDRAERAYEEAQERFIP